MNEDNQTTEETADPVDSTAGELSQAGDTTSIEGNVTAEDGSASSQAELLSVDNQSYSELLGMIDSVGSEIDQLLEDAQEMQTSLLLEIKEQGNRSISAMRQGTVTNICVLATVLLTILFAFFTLQRKKSRRRKENTKRRDKQEQLLSTQLNDFMLILKSQTEVIQNNRQITKDEIDRLETKLSDLAKLSVQSAQDNMRKTEERGIATSNPNKKQPTPIETLKEDVRRFINEMLNDSRYNNSYFISVIFKLHQIDGLASLDPVGKHTWNFQGETKLTRSTGLTGHYLGVKEDNIMHVFPNRSFLNQASDPTKIFSGFSNYKRITMVQKSATFKWSENERCWVLQTKGMLEQRAMN